MDGIAVMILEKTIDLIVFLLKSMVLLLWNTIKMQVNFIKTSFVKYKVGFFSFFIFMILFWGGAYLADCYDNSLLMKICTLGMCENVSDYAKLITTPFLWVLKISPEQLGLPAEIGMLLISMIIAWLSPTILLLTFEAAAIFYPIIYAIVVQLIFAVVVKIRNIDWKKIMTIVHRK